MKAAVLHELNKPMTIEDFEIPGIGPDEVLIQVKACGVCHTDFKVIEGRIPSKVPTIIGHEVSGTIAEVGAGQRGAFTPGDAVIVGTRYRCGHCQYCMAGRENLCRARPAPASLKRTDGREIFRWNVGGFSQYLALPGYMVFKLPEGLSLEEASVVGCRMTTAYNAVKNSAEIKPGDSALVIGCGGVGLNTIQFLRTFGAYPIIAVDLYDHKLEAAKKFGATHVINGAKEDPVKAVRDLTDGGVNKSFEALGQCQNLGSNHSSDPPRRHGDDHRRPGQSAVHHQRRQLHHAGDQNRRRGAAPAHRCRRSAQHGARQTGRRVRD